MLDGKIMPSKMVAKYKSYHFVKKKKKLNWHKISPLNGHAVKYGMLDNFLICSVIFWHHQDQLFV